MPFAVQTNRGNTDRNTTNKSGDHFDRRRESFCRLHPVGNFPRRHHGRTPSEVEEIKKLLLSIYYPNPVNGFRPLRSESPIDGGQFRRSISGNVGEANTETWDRNCGSADRYSLLGHTAGADGDECRTVVAG